MAVIDIETVIKNKNTMETIFRKVLAKERLPEKDDDYFVYIYDEDDRDGEKLVSAMHFSKGVSEIWKKEVAYWLEEIKIESVEKQYGG